MERPNLMAGIKRAVGVLENDLDILADFHEGRLIAGIRVAIPDTDLALLRRFQTEQGAGKGGFATTGFTHQADTLSRMNGQIHMIDGAEMVAAEGGELARQGIVANDVAGEEDRGCVLKCRVVVVKRRLGAVRHMGRSVKQAAAIGMGQGVEQIRQWAMLDNFPFLHDGNLVRHVGNDRQIMGNQAKEPTGLLPSGRAAA